MEAVAYGQQANRFINELQIGKVYIFNYVGFETAELPPPFGLSIPTNYYVIMHTRTEIRPAGSNVSIPKLPSWFMDFNLAAKLRNKMLTGAYNFLVHNFRLCAISDHE
jgi:hypothetical protein